MCRNVLLLTIGLIIAGTSPVRAQGGLTLTPHQRIRVTAPPISPRRMEGVFTGQRGDTLLMLRENFPSQPQSTLIPFHAIERLEVRGRRSPSAGAWRGFWIGPSPVACSERSSTQEAPTYRAIGSTTCWAALWGWG